MAYRILAILGKRSKGGHIFICGVFVENVDVMNYANFGIFVTSTFAKIVKNDLTISIFSPFFDILTFQMTSKFEFDLIRPTKFRGARTSFS